MFLYLFSVIQRLTRREQMLFGFSIPSPAWKQSRNEGAFFQNAYLHKFDFLNGIIARQLWILVTFIHEILLTFAKVHFCVICCFSAPCPSLPPSLFFYVQVIFAFHASTLMFNLVGAGITTVHSLTAACVCVCVCVCACVCMYALEVII